MSSESTRDPAIFSQTCKSPQISALCKRTLRLFHFLMHFLRQVLVSRAQNLAVQWGYLKASSWDGARCGQRPANWAAPQLTVSPGGRMKLHFHFPLLFALCGVSTMTSATSCHWTQTCRAMVASSGVGARTGGWPRDVPPHPFKVKLGDHFSAAPEITPGWGLAPGCGTHGTPLRCRIEFPFSIFPLFHFSIFPFFTFHFPVFIFPFFHFSIFPFFHFPFSIFHFPFSISFIHSSDLFPVPLREASRLRKKENSTEGATASILKLLVPNLTAPPAVQAGKQHAPCAATSPRNWFTSLATSTISVPKVLTQDNSGTVFDHTQGLKSDGTQELRIIRCVIIVNRRRNGRSPRQRRAHPEPRRSTWE